jgi:hypothetical protein
LETEDKNKKRLCSRQTTLKPDDFEHRLKTEIERELHTLDELLASSDQFFTEYMNYVEHIQPVCDENRATLIDRDYLYQNLVFGKGIYRFVILRHCLGIYTHLSEKGKVFQRDDLFNHPTAGIFVCIYMVIQQLFTDGNHRTAHYLLQLILATKNGQSQRELEIRFSPEEMREMNDFHKEFLINGFIRILSFPLTYRHVDHFPDFIETIYLCLNQNYDSNQKRITTIPKRHYLYRCFMTFF